MSTTTKDASTVMASLLFDNNSDPAPPNLDPKDAHPTTNSNLMMNWLSTPSTQYPLDPPLGSSLSTKTRKPQQTNAAMGKILSALDTPLDDMENNDWGMQDPDLMPSIDDWMLVSRFLTADKRAAAIIVVFDSQRFLENFFLEPPPLRLVLCAIVAHFESLPDTVSFSFFRRARKAVMRAQPSLRTAQAFLFIYIFSLWKGQPSLGQPFFKLAVDMCLFLQIDKDDETVLSELNELEREERARFYGTCLYAQSVEQSLSPDPVSMRLSPDKLKPGKEFTKPYVAFLGHGPTLHFNNVANLISDIKRHHLRIPSSVYELINSEESLILRNHMRHVHSKINSKYLLLGETDSLAPAQVTRFLAKLSTLTQSEIPEVILVQLIVLTSISTCLRPALYVTSLASHRPTLIDRQTRQNLTSIIHQSLDAVDRIFRITSIVLQSNDVSIKHGVAIRIFPAYAMFEAIIVYWFLICRMRVEWRACVVGFVDGSFWGGVEEKVGMLGGFIREKADAGPTNDVGVFNPIRVCMEAMVEEIRGVLRGGGVVVRDSVDEVVVGMKVVSLDKDESVERDPWCFLGLLGMEVVGRVRWKGKSEEQWRLFWKTH